MNQPTDVAPGVRLWSARLDVAGQALLLEDVLARVKEAPFFRPTMPGTGKPFSVRMTNFGPLGWVSDQKKGYRYENRHPVTGRPWPEIPAILLELWRECSSYSTLPEACLVNYYAEDARMGLHQDSDEAALDVPVLSVSLGDSAVFRFGAKSKTRSLKLNSGDVLAFGGAARLMHHGIDRVLGGSSSLIPMGGRINLTLRRVNPSG